MATKENYQNDFHPTPKLAAQSPKPTPHSRPVISLISDARFSRLGVRDVTPVGNIAHPGNLSGPCRRELVGISGVRGDIL